MATLSVCLAFVGLTMVMAQRGEGPQMAQNFYDRILNNPGSERFGQNLTFIKETLHDDWNLRPNPFGETFGNHISIEFSYFMCLYVWLFVFNLYAYLSVCKLYKPSNRFFFCLSLSVCFNL